MEYQIYTESEFDTASLSTGGAPSKRMCCGSVRFNDNNVTLFVDSNVSGPVVASVLIDSRDDVLVQGNKFDAFAEGSGLAHNLIVNGQTVRVVDNRLREEPRFAADGKGTFVSAVTSGECLNLTTGNQATHCVKVIGPPRGTIGVPNQSLYELFYGRPCWKRIIKGSVLDSAGATVAGAKISIMGTTHATSTGSSGSFELEVPFELANQPIVLSVEENGRVKDFSVSSGQDDIGPTVL
jgi:hypothetical protein